MNVTRLVVAVRDVFEFHLEKVLIVLGVWMWVWFAIVKYVLGITVGVTPFLVCHLLCVVPAAIFTGRGWMMALAKRTFRNKPKIQTELTE